MIKSFSTVLVAAVLTACGGGGDGAGSDPAPAPASAAPAPAPANSTPTPPPAATTPVVFENPPPTFSGSSFSGRSWNISAPGGNYPISFTGVTDLTVAGDLNKFWLSAAQPGGMVTISGNQNTLVFRTSATPATVTVTGSANTFYLPEGSPIKLEGAGAAMSTIKYYKL